MLGSLMLASNSGQSSLFKYSSYLVHSSHRAALSFSLSSIVVFAQSSTLAHVLAISSPTRAHAASPSVGTGCGLLSRL
ncbi:uncharacterized protein M421DRAFT_403504 [Didymella exigua CBS 183.55]|uniref:Uncharacterized protein n=1 Tax=Didymella exigua CBS 183.55 TaxID=1150837 RepID=A0A6A5RA69_9PLEO|nr:uncharacterized protein M421DRAFT_403504 [Didymella exigua CBS 183.55]KAF1924229.1 hypothetical protein M421DRAFT_403504 [Didymella exigua CBS 183.55]